MSAPTTPPRRPQNMRWASRPTEDSETRRFQQERVALMARTFLIFLGGISLLGGLLVGVLKASAFTELHIHPLKILSYLMLLVWLSIWLFLRRGRRPSWLVSVCDLACVLLMTCMVGLGLTYAPPHLPLQFAGLVVGLLLLVLRAALVPSRPGWTMAVGLLAGPPVLIGGYLRAVAAPSVVPPVLEAAGQTIWWLGVCVATAFVSRTIYGLVTQVAQATRLGQYTLLEKIGEGGMGEVYRAQHALLRRPTAVKLLLPGRTSPESMARFEREVQLTSRLSHPNTIAIYDYGRTPEGIFYYAMEYLDGVSLEQLVRDEGALPPGRAVHFLLQVAEALIEAHGVGLIHRDIKPANIMACERGAIPDVAKVLDFGLVKALDPDEADPGLSLVAGGGVALVGTPLFMSPEAISGQDVDARSDLYSLGATAYFLLTGTPPFTGRSAVEICSQHLHSPPPPPSQHLTAPLPAGLEAVVLACLAKEPARRPPDAAALHDRLLAAQLEAPWTRAEAAAWWRGFSRKGARPPGVSPR